MLNRNLWEENRPMLSFCLRRTAINYLGKKALSTVHCALANQSILVFGLCLVEPHCERASVVTKGTYTKNGELRAVHLLFLSDHVLPYTSHLVVGGMTARH